MSDEDVIEFADAAMELERARNQASLDCDKAREYTKELQRAVDQAQKNLQEKIDARDNANSTWTKHGNRLREMEAAYKKLTGKEMTRYESY